MIKDNVEKVRGQIAAVCARIKVDPAKITLVCVTKGRSIDQIQVAIDAGLTNLGENKVQEAQEKYSQLANVKWHMIGHLQSNKARDAVKIFDLIHSVDSVSLAQEIDKQAAKINKIQSVLLEVKTSPEATKFGFAPQVLADAYAEIAKLKNVRVQGLMTLAPLVSDAKEAAPYFATLRQLRDKINPSWLLSMGMSDDFSVALTEGAEMIRLGRAIFKE
ncbi:MAG: YggS family pyridoxal phosphate-dependent enzyme [Candidatus Omnitrophota bacterium]